MIGVIGCGNMASAIVKGIHQKKPEERFLTYTPSFTRAQTLAEAVKGEAVKELSDLRECDALIIGCKPQQFEELAANLTKAFDLSGKYIISIMAAVPAVSVIDKLGSKMVTRIMPNTPALLGEGVSLAFHSKDVTESWRQKSYEYFSACSKVHILNSESLFDQVTTVTGSGPAYVFYFAKTLADNLKAWGVNESDSRAMVTQLFKGAAALMEASPDKNLGTLIDEVTSKGGVTIEAVKVYQEKKLDEISEEALKAAVKRSGELSEGFR